MITKPLRISWSALRAHEECKEKSYLIREGRRSKVTNIRNFYPGTVVDVIMREWLDFPPNSIRPPMADFVPAVMAQTQSAEKEKGNVVRFRDAEDRNEITKFCTTLVNRLQPILEEHVLPYQHEHGKWFKVPANLTDADGGHREVLLTGEMDLLVQNNGPVIWDLKGTADDNYWRKVVAQLTFYDLAVWISTGTKSRHVGLIQPMCTERILAFKVTDDARRELMLRIQRYALDVWAGERSCTTNKATCHFCDVRHACTRFAQPQLDSFGDLADQLRAAAGDPA